jgi:hypothetical protein
MARIFIYFFIDIDYIYFTSLSVSLNDFGLVKGYVSGSYFSVVADTCLQPSPHLSSELFLFGCLPCLVISVRSCSRTFLVSQSRDRMSLYLPLAPETHE